MDYQDHFAEALAKLRDECRYRIFADLERHAGRFPRPNGIPRTARATS
jgi:5-aminolevulinate synthase